jgi:hypothetical protein
MLKRELENNSRQSLNLTKNGQRDSPNKSQLTLFMRLMKGGVVVDEDDDERETIKLTRDPCDSKSGY